MIKGSTLATIAEEIAATFKMYARKNKDTLKPAAEAALIRYAENEEIMAMMDLSFFEEWEAGGRLIPLQTWIENAIQDVLSVYN